MEHTIFERSDAINSLLPNAEFGVSDDGEGVIELIWMDNRPQPTEAEIDAEVARLQAEYDAQEYARDRSAAYPSIEDQADMQYWDAVNGTTTWQDAIAAVKDAHPKP